MKTNTFTTTSGRYLVEAYGNGWAYEVTDQKDGANFFVQDESAALVQYETDDFQNEAAIATLFDAFHEAYDQQ